VFQYLIYPDGSLNISGAVEELWGFFHDLMQNSALIWNQISAAGSYQDVQNSIQGLLTQNQVDLSMKYLMPSGELHTSWIWIPKLF
jgi:cell division FtsZ-interacting protein ZapD